MQRQAAATRWGRGGADGTGRGLVRGGTRTLRVAAVLGDPTIAIAIAGGGQGGSAGTCSALVSPKSVSQSRQGSITATSPVSGSRGLCAQPDC